MLILEIKYQKCTKTDQLKKIEKIWLGDELQTMKSTTNRLEPFTREITKARLGSNYRWQYYTQNEIKVVS